MLPSCALETLLYLHILRVRRSLNSVQSQQDQMLLIISNTFLFLVLGFHAVGIDCRDKDSPEIVCAGVVPDSQILQTWILAFRFLQIRQLAVEGDAGSRFKKNCLRQRTESRSSRWTHSLPPKSPSGSSFLMRVKSEKLH